MQLYLPFDRPLFEPASLPSGPNKQYNLTRKAKAAENSCGYLPCEYRVGTSIVVIGAGGVKFEPMRTFTTLEVMTPHIGFSSALLLEMVGYKTLQDLARSGYCLGSIPSIGPKKTEKILKVLEGFGLSPPRLPSKPPPHWQRVFDQALRLQ